MPFRRRETSPSIPSLKRYPPSRGTAGSAFVAPSIRLSQNSQYNAFAKIQKRGAGITAAAPWNRQKGGAGSAVGGEPGKGRGTVDWSGHITPPNIAGVVAG